MKEKRRFLHCSKILEIKSLKAMYRWSIQGPTASFTSSLGVLAVVGMGAYLLQTDSTFTKGQFFAFLLYANMFYEPVRQLVSINNMISAGKASGKEVFEILDENIEIKNPNKPKVFPSGNLSIKFTDAFAYDRRSVVDRLNFFLPAGSTTALVGPTGEQGKVPSQILFSDIMMLIKGVSLGEIDVRELSLVTCVKILA